MTAGGDDYIRTKDNRVVALALNRRLNPEAPYVVVVGIGPKIQRRAELLAGTQHAVPAYVKIETDAWDYQGEFLPAGYRRDVATIKQFCGNRDSRKVAGILFLERVNDIDLAGGDFPNQKARREVEDAAIKFVMATLKKSHFTVFDHQPDNLGYDLLAVSPQEELKVEVKGTGGAEQRFFITRNERACSAQPNWRLAIVTNARSEPSVELMDAKEMQDRFEFRELAWECTPRAKIVLDEQRE